MSLSSELNTLLNNTKSVITNAAMEATEPHTPHSSSSALEGRVKKQFEELVKYKEIVGVQTLINQGDQFVKLLATADYVNLADLASRIEESVDTLISCKSEEKPVAATIAAPKCDHGKLNTLLIYVNTGLSTAKQVSGAVEDDKKDILELRDAKIKTLDKQIQGFDALVQFDQYRELVEQITAFKNLLSADPVDVAKMEAVQKLIISNVAKIKAADSEEVEEEEDLTTIPTSLQDKAVQDELIKYLSPDIYNLMQSPKFKPLATHIEALFKRLSESEGSYGEEQIDYILTTAALDPQQFLFLILFDAVKSGVDLSTLGLVAASTDAENALFLSLKDISYSAFGDYLADKAKVLISEKQDSELKIALGNRVHAVKREDFTKLMTYARLYYDPSVDLLVSTIMNTENKEIKEKLVTLLPEAERNKIKKIQDFIDEKDVEKSTSLAKDLIQDKSTSSQFLAALPYIAVRDFSQIDKIILAILAEHRNDENSIEKNIGTLFRKVAEKSAGKAQEYLSKLDAIIARAGITYKRDIELTKQAAISAVALAVSYTDIDTAIKIALTSKRKGPLSDLFESLGSRDQLHALDIITKYSRKKAAECLESLMNGYASTAPEKAVDFVTSLKNFKEKEKIIAYECIVGTLIRITDSSNEAGIKQALALTANMKIGSIERDIFSSTIAVAVVESDMEKALKLASEISSEKERLNCYKSLALVVDVKNQKDLLLCIEKNEKVKFSKSSFEGRLPPVREWVCEELLALSLIDNPKDSKNQDNFFKILDFFSDEAKSEKILKITTALLVKDSSEAQIFLDLFFEKTTQSDFFKEIFADSLAEHSSDMAIKVALTICDEKAKEKAIYDMAVGDEDEPVDFDSALKLYEKCSGLLSKKLRSELRESLISKFFGNLHSSCEEGDDERFGLLISNLSALVKTLRHEDFSAFHQFSFLVSLYFSIETALKDFPHLDFRSKLPRVEDLEKVLKVYDFIKDKIVDELLEGSIGFSNLSTEEQIYCKCYQAIDVCIYALEKEYKDTIPSAKTIENIVNVFYKAIGDVNNETLKSDVIRVLVSTLCTSLNIKQMLHLIRSLSGPLLDSIRIEFINVLVDRNEIKSAAAIINTIDDTEVREELLQALADEFKLTSSLGSEEASELESSSEEEDPFEIWSSSESEDSFEEI